MKADIEKIFADAQLLAGKAKKRSWFSSLPADQQSELLEIKAAYLGKRYADLSLAALCKAIINYMKERGWAVPNHHETIRRWISSSDQ